MATMSHSPCIFWPFVLAVSASTTCVTGCWEFGDPPVRSEPYESAVLEASHDTTTRRDVVLISIDTCRADYLSCYGYAGQTTVNIDSLAEDGVTFTRAQATNPITLPSHCSLLTGTIPPVHGVRNNGAYRLGDNQLTLTEVLSANGYQTAAFVGAFPLDGRFGLAQGFDTYDDQMSPDRNSQASERRAEEVTRAAISWLDQRGDEPFFLFVHYFDPHFSYQPPEPFRSRYRESPYAGEIAYTDDCLGKLLDRLKELRLYESSIIVITADHGESLDEHEEMAHGFFVYQTTMRVPLVIKLPETRENIRIQNPVSLIDIAPTILTTLQLDVPSTMQGIDLRPYCAGQEIPTIERFIYGESLAATAFGCAPLRSIVSDRWHYISTMRPELYDLDRDPGELDNVIDQFPQEAAQLDQRLQDILDGPTGDRPQHDTAVRDEEAIQRLRSLGYVGGELNESVDINPGMADAKDHIRNFQRMMLAQGLISARRFDEAMLICLELLDQQVAVPKVHMLLASLAAKQGNENKAIAHYQNVVDAAAESDQASASSMSREADYFTASAHNHIGMIFRRRRRLAEAIEHFEQAAQRYPENPKYHIDLAGVLVDRASATSVPEEREQLVSQAKQHIKHALELDSDDANTHVYVGRILNVAGDVRQAELHFERALEINPENRTAREKLELIRQTQSDGSGLETNVD